MSSSLQTVTTDIQEFLREAAPESWRVDSVLNVLGNVQTPLVLTWQFMGVTTEMGANFKGTEYIGAEFMLTLFTNQKDLTKALAALNTALPELLPVLDASPDLSWETAEYAVMDTGESAYRIPITVLCTY